MLSVFRKAGIDENAMIDAPVVIAEDREAQLAARLLQFEETLSVVAREGTPHVMCAYLYDLAGLFSGFYEHCPILSAESEETRNSRLKLALLTAKPSSWVSIPSVSKPSSVCNKQPGESRVSLFGASPAGRPAQKYLRRYSVRQRIAIA
nr:Arginine--tRNA ligase [Klebsiella pneumoniae]